MSIATDKKAMMKQALELAEKGFRVLPLYEPKSCNPEPKCSCRLMEKCDSIGKHPRTKNGVIDASSDPSQIEKWWRTWPYANIGVAAGDGLLILDVDGDDGEHSLLELEDKYGALEGHYQVVTPNGRHYYFKTDYNFDNSVKRLGDGLDIRSHNGFVVSIGSTHVTGGKYDLEYSSPEDETPLPAPQWLIDELNDVQSANRGADVIDINKAKANKKRELYDGFRNRGMYEELCALRKRGHGDTELLAFAFAFDQQEAKTKGHESLSDAEIRRLVNNAMKKEPDENFKSGGYGTWTTNLKVDSDGRTKRTPGNAVLYLANHKDWQGVLGFNEMRQRVVWLKDPPEDYQIPKASVGDQLADWHITHVIHWFERCASLAFTPEILIKCIETAAQANAFHPVREYLTQLEWDGVSRVDKWLTTYLGADNSAYNCMIGRCWLISAVARVMKPGCQADHVLVLEGPQGRGKSTGMATLFGSGKDWYMESLPELTQGGGKDAMASLAGPWCIEIAELDAIRGKASTKTKDFISRRVDEYRPSYGRCHIRLPRQCVFVGTTNQKSWLTDPTGGRRFWPCKVGTINRQAILDDRDQIWAEVFQLYTQGEQWWPDEKYSAMLEEQQEARYSQDVWEEVIAQYILREKYPEEINVTAIYRSALNIEEGRISRADQTRVGGIMSRLGYEKTRRMSHGRRMTCYVRRRSSSAVSDDP